MIRVTIMPLPQLGQRRRGIGYLIWLVGCDVYTEIPTLRIATGMSRFLLNIEKRSLPRLMLSGDGLAGKDAM
jgi:hypothetical protein